MQSYLSLLDMLNPMHRLWSDGQMEQAHRGTRLLLEEVQFLRCVVWTTSHAMTQRLPHLVDRIERIVGRNTGKQAFTWLMKPHRPKP
jgi:hypothetical protein